MPELLPSQLILLILALPLAAAVLLPLCRQYPNLRDGLSFVSGVALFVAVFQLWQLFRDGQAVRLDLLEIMPGIQLAFELEPLGAVFALTASFLWPVTTLYSIGYMRGNNESAQTRFAVCFALALAAAMGIALSANLFSLFVFYELMTLVTYPLVTHAGTEQARRSGRTYLGILMGTSIGFQLSAIIATYYFSGTLEFTPGGILAGKAGPLPGGILLFLFMYGIGKAALMPFHRWLPAAMVAPTPVSALLHAVAVVKAGVFSVVKIITYVFGVDYLSGIIKADWWAGGWLVYMAGATILIASVVALRQDNLKKRLAYSTVSQLSYITMAAAVLVPLSIQGAVLHIAAHAFGKITLFFTAGAIYTAAHKTKVSELDGIGYAMPWTMTAFAVGAFSMIGIPPTVGFLSKWYMLSGAAQAHHYTVVAVIIASTLLNAAYFLPIIQAAFFKKPQQTAQHGEAPLPMVVALSFTAAGCLILFFYADVLLELSRQLYFLEQ